MRRVLVLVVAVLVLVHQVDHLLRARRDPRFGHVTLRHLLTMTSGLADLDPHYDLDLRTVALRHTRIVEPPGRRFRYNNVNPVLLGMVLERVTGATVSAYLSERLWGRWAWRPTAPGAWTAAGRGWSCCRPGSTAGPSTSPPSPAFQYDWWTWPGTGPPYDFWAQGNHGQFVYVAPAATWSWSGSASTTTTTTGPSCWPHSPAAYERARSRRSRPREAAVPNEPVTRGYVVGPGEGVPDQGPEVKASGRSNGGSLTVIEMAVDGGPPRHTAKVRTIQQAYGIARS